MIQRDEGDEDAAGDGAWITLPTREQKARFQATRKAERVVRRINRTFGTAGAGFEVEFLPTVENSKFTSENLLKIFCDIRQHVQDAQPRLNAKGGVTVRVPQQSHIEQLKSINTIANIKVQLNLPSAASLWGRVSGVHPSFSEKDLLELLKPQGVVEVQREKYSTCESATSTETKRVQKPSNRIRLRFQTDLKPEITIAYVKHRVTLCAASPLQCLNCCGFGHRAASCPERQAPRCRNCAAQGHQLWQCTARPKCVNCEGSHAANDSKCPVYAVYAKVAQERFVGKIVAGLDNVSVKESAHFVAGSAPAPAASADGQTPSFAAVVGAPAMVALARTTDEGERVVCYLPKPPAKKQAQVRTPKPPAKPISRV